MENLKEALEKIKEGVNVTPIELLKIEEVLIEYGHKNWVNGYQSACKLVDKIFKKEEQNEPIS